MKEVIKITKKYGIILLGLVFALTVKQGCFAAHSLRYTPIVKVVEENIKSVVNISTERIVYLKEHPFWEEYGSKFDIFFDNFFAPFLRRPVKLKSIGSGVIVDETGIIVTNVHIVHMATNLFVRLHDGTTVEGKVMYEDPSCDLAIIKINPPYPLKPVKLGNSDNVMLGETVVAIGNPLGLNCSVSSGILSGKNRQLYLHNGFFLPEGLLQTDAPINPGNSGGALFNLDGELIGINVAIAQKSQNIGFAIPVSRVKKLLADYQRNKDLVIKRKGTGGTSFYQRDSKYYLREKMDLAEEMEKFHRKMKQLLGDIFDRWEDSSEIGMFESKFSLSPNLHIEEKDEKYIIKLKIKGLDKDKIEVEISRHTLTVSGQRSVKIQQKSPSGVYKSESFGSFIRSIPLPPDADTSGIRTQIKGDTLIIVVPKKKK